MPGGLHDGLPVQLLGRSLHPQRLRELRRDPVGRRGRFQGPQARRQDRPRQEGQVHRLRRRRRYLRHRPAVAVGRHGARPRHGVRVLRQRRVHEHGHPALRRHPLRRLDHHLRGGLVRPGQDAASQGPHVHPRRAPHPLYRTGFRQPLAGPRAQGGEGHQHRRPRVHQRARSLPPRLAHPLRHDGRDRAPGRGDQLLAALRGGERRVEPH